MKPILEHLPKSASESFVALEFDYPFFPTPWHYHPEFELVLIKKSKGVRFIGDSISDFQEGDVTLIGSNLPHYYRNDHQYYDPKSEKKAQSIVVHFLTSSFGRDFEHLPESSQIKELFKRSMRGLDITGSTRDYVAHSMTELISLSGMERWIKLVEILHKLSISNELKEISAVFLPRLNDTDSRRIQQVFDFALANFQKQIRVSEAAKICKLSETSFCRYFKQHTKKGFSEFLLQIRVNHASKLLLETEKSVTEICFSSGFNNISNFNRHFKKVYGVSPLTYRNRARFNS